MMRARKIFDLHFYPIHPIQSTAILICYFLIFDLSLIATHRIVVAGTFTACAKQKIAN